MKIPFVVAALFYWHLMPPSLADTITITSGEYAPFTTQSDPDGGLVNRIVKEAFARSGVTVKLAWRPWARVIVEARSGKAQAASYFALDTERDKDFIPVGPVVIDISSMFYRAGEEKPVWKNYSELRGNRIGITRGYTYPPDFNTLAENDVLEVETADTDELNLRKLLAKRIDLFPSNDLITYKLLNEKFSEDERLMIAKTDQVYIAIETYLLISKKAPNAQELAEKFTKGLDSMRKDGTHAAYVAELMSTN
ncbi:Bacterial extracellular solute-binding proteins, family 3 [Roseibium album]|nr:Bacterial extracellular solute-binding proteins, family 3 [Roseibium album]